MGANFDHIDQGRKTIDNDRNEIFQKKSRYATFDHNSNEELLEELKEEPVDQRLRKYKSNWLSHVTRINNKMPKIMLNYIPNGRGRLGRPLKRLLGEAKTGLSRPN
jgi:hypothetical protein